MKIWYCVINGGDGSAHSVFFKAEKSAEARAKHEEEEYGDGFAEDCVGYLEVKGDVNFKESYIGEDEDGNEIYPDKEVI